MNVTIIGETCIDHTVFGTCPRICPEGPAPVFVPEYWVETGGMAANVLNNLKNVRPGFNVRLITSNVNPIKKRLVDKPSGQLVLRVDENDTVPRISDIGEIDPYIQYADFLIVSDYDKGYLTHADLRHISNKAREHETLTFLDTKKDGGVWAEAFDFIKINQKEFENNHWAELFIEHKEKFIITMAENGCLYGDDIFPVESKVSAHDVTGAGDTFLATFAIGFIETRTIEKAIKFAQECCQLVVQKTGTAVPYDE